MKSGTSVRGRGRDTFRLHSCLKFALDVEEETIRRSLVEPSHEDMAAACDAIERTRTTPIKETKRRRLSGMYHP